MTEVTAVTSGGHLHVGRAINYVTQVPPLPPSGLAVGRKPALAIARGHSLDRPPCVCGVRSALGGGGGGVGWYGAAGLVMRKGESCSAAFFFLAGC